MGILAKDYRDSLGVNFIRSFSRNDNPWDNACIESSHALIKREKHSTITVSLRRSLSFNQSSVGRLDLISVIFFYQDFVTIFFF